MAIQNCLKATFVLFQVLLTMTNILMVTDDLNKTSLSCWSSSLLYNYISYDERKHAETERRGTE